MNCKDCFHYEVCENYLNYLSKTIQGKSAFLKIHKKKCPYEKDKSKIMELPFIAMIEQHLVNGKFVNSNIQNKNGMYAVVYFDKKKSGIPLIDICGKSAYNEEEAEAWLKELQNG